MNYELKDKPLLSVLLFMIAGIFGGMVFFTAYVSTRTAIILLFVLLLSALLFRRKATVSSLLLLLSSFVLGVVLITNSIGRGYEPTVSPAIIDEMEEFMSIQRDKMLHTYHSAGLSDDVYGTVAAMTLGERKAVSPSLRESYNISGVSHIFALSGLHLAIIFMFLSLLLPTKIFPRSSAVVQLVVLWTFVFLVGIHPSILRAAVMFTCYALCRLFSRSARNFDVLIFTAFLLLVYNPQWLFDVGFQMSFMAMVGIFPLSSRLMPLIPRPRWMQESYMGVFLWSIVSIMWGMLVITISANVGVMPLIVLYFGRLSFYGLLANFIVSPCATLILFLSILLQVFPTPYRELPGVCLDHVVTFMNRSVHYISALPGASIDGISLTASQTILIYVILAALILIARRIYHAIQVH